MRTLFVALAFAALAAFTYSLVRGDSTTPADDPNAGSQGSQASLRPGRSAFEPFNPGPDEAKWSYESLTPEEKAVVDRGRNREMTQIHAGYSAAVDESTAAALAHAAATKLQAENAESMGVVE